jgi:hypothetical protein
MKTNLFAVALALASFTLTAPVSGQQNTDQVKGRDNPGIPGWVTREESVWVEEGIIFAKGSAKMATLSMSMVVSRTRACNNIAVALSNNSITGYAPLPEDTKEPTPFNHNGISGTFGDISIISRFEADDRTMFQLITCAGAVVNQQ